MKTKRFLSILLSLVLVLGMLPGMSLTAFAEGNTTTITPGTDDAKTGTGTMTITLTIKAAQTITASDVTATYGDTDKAVSASVTEPTTGGGAITYAVKDGSGDYIDVAADGKLTIKKVPPTDGKAYVIVKAAATDDYAETTKEVTVTISKAEATVTAKDQSIMVGGTVPDLSASVLNTHYTVTGLVGTDVLTTAPTLAYQKDGSAATPDNTTAGTYDIVPSGASAGDNYNISYSNGTLTITAKDAQTITASDVTATYGDMNKSVSATTDGNGEISYAVKAGSENYIDVNVSTGALTIKAVPADGKAYVTVTASETTTGGTGGNGYAAATKDVTVNISKATVTIAAKDQSIYVGGTVPTLSGADFYTISGLVGEDTLTTNPTLVYQKNGSVATPDNTTAGTYDIVPSGASAGDNYNISYTNGTLTISDKGTQTISAENVTVTYGDTGKSVSATVTDPATGGGAISYSVKSGDAVTVDENTGALTIVKSGSAVITVTAAETATYAQATKDVNVTVNTKAMTVSAENVNVTVDGQPHGITVNVTDPASGATVKYGTTEGTYDQTTSPTQTEVGEKTVYYQVTADNYTTYTGSAKVTVSAKAAQTITAADVTATYGDTDKKVTATTNGNGAISYAVKDGSTDYIDVNASSGALTIKKVPTDGKAYVTVTAAGTATYEQATKDVTVTINKADPTVTAPTAKTLTYTGSAQELVNAGSVTGGTLYYAVTTENTAPTDDNLYTTSIPTGTNAGTYYVWYKAVGDADHNDSDPGCATVTISVPEVVATPVFSPAEGTYTEAQSVTISCATEGATIHYTTNGSNPTASSTTYSSAISVGETTTIKAIAVKEGMTDSVVASAEYTINITPDTVATPTFSPDAGEYEESMSVTISCTTEGATIYYTTDGTMPIVGSSIYTSPITVSETTTIQAIGVKEGMTDSSVASATYTISDDPGPGPEEPGVSLDLSSISVKPGDSATVTATTVPEGLEVTWSSEDESIAAVSDGVITGVAEGTTNILASVEIEGTTYTASVSVIVTKKPAPPKPDDPSKKEEEKEEKPHTHHYVWETIEATEESDGELKYACDICGAVQTRVPISAYYVFNKNTAEKIRKAGQGATVYVETSRYISFHKMVMEALAERPDVTLRISFLDEEYKGNRVTVTIPAGTDAMTLVDDNGFVGFLYLAVKYGYTLVD